MNAPRSVETHVLLIRRVDVVGVDAGERPEVMAEVAREAKGPAETAALGQ